MANEGRNGKHQKRAPLVTVPASPKSSHDLPPLPAEEMHDYLRHWENTGTQGDSIVNWSDLDQSEEEETPILTEGDSLNNVPPPPPAEESHEYLLHWERNAPDGDKIMNWSDLDESEEADSEDDPDGFGDDDLDAAEKAFIQAREQKNSRNRTVPESLIVDIINDSMEMFTNQWKPGQGLELTDKEIREAFDASRLLKRAEDRGDRKQLVKKYQADIQYFKRQLDGLAKEICDYHGNSKESEIRKICQILGTHVENLEEAKWFLSVYGNASDGDFEGYIDSESDSTWSGDMDDREMLVDVEDPSDGPSIMYKDKEAAVVSENCTNVKNSKTPKAARKESLASRQATAPIEQNAVLDLASQISPEDEPENSSILTISHWNMKSLIARRDRKRIVMKVFLEMTPEQRQMVRTRFQAVKKSNMLREIRNCIDMLRRKDRRMLGVLPSDLVKVKTVTNFFLCWWFGDNHMHEALPQDKFDELAIDLRDSDDLEFFYDWVEIILFKTFTNEAFRLAEEDIIVISDDETP